MADKPIKRYLASLAIEELNTTNLKYNYPSCRMTKIKITETSSENKDV